ncbi:N-acetylglucosamine-1-phosphate transferase subunits alpha and beta [Haematobia irritans]|uniref:N-acetylglucosamine-1-phosphate transferase subunits alpha and beta n=1 Tax=Haematobia irritans TaxID=7368 RepID=UPI003F4FE092
MNLRRKSKSCLRRRHTWKLIVVTLLVTATVIVYQIKLTYSGTQVCLGPIDVVYTWVNGSDPEFINSISKYSSNYDNSRFDDKNELKYSLRSLEKFAPWIRHIYIITNGQIPKWLDLTNEKITIVPHEFLVSNLEWLPIFSSSAIETFIHRIHNLSPRFIYLNDDIFLGSKIYPEDLYTESGGVNIFQAWIAPDCALNCPWTYIGDATCDHHCNVKQCQYDGGDCKNENTESDIKEKNTEQHKNRIKNTLMYTKKKDFPSKNTHTTEIRKNKTRSFKEILIKYKNVINQTDMKTAVENFNKQMHSKELKHRDTLAIDNHPTDTAKVTRVPDIFSESLIHTNMLLNRRFGFKARHVIAHVGLLLEKNIIETIHKDFKNEILTTAQHRFRAANDVQFSFLYYNYLMEESYNVSIDQIFNEFDTDHSLTWSDREIRTLLTRLFPLPLDWSAVRFFEEIIQNCTFKLMDGTEQRDKSNVYSTILYDRYADSNLPTVTRDLVKNCAPLVEALNTNFGVRNKYKYKVNSKRIADNNFMMLTSNVSNVVESLDKIRRSPRKFNCINDNMDPHHEDNKLIRQFLDDFYLSFFPHRSQFELHPQYRNKFDNWRDYMKWRRRQRVLIILIYGSCSIFLAYLVRSIFIYKAKFVRRFCMQKF